MPGLKLMAELGLDGNGFASGLKTAENKAGGFGSAIGALKGKIAAAFSVGAVVAWLKHATDVAKQIKEMSLQFNLTTDEVQKLEKASGRVGLEADAAATAIFKLAKARKDAAEGDVGKREAFDKYGVSLKDLQNPLLRDVDLFKIMAHRLKEIGVDARTNSDFLELMGRSGAKMIGLMSELEKLKPIKLISEKEIDELVTARRELDELKKSAEKDSIKTTAYLLKISKMGGAMFLESLTLGTKAERERFGEAMRRLTVSENTPPEKDQTQKGDLFVDKKAEEDKNKTAEASYDLAEKERQFTISQLSDAEQIVALEKERVGLLERAAGIEKLAGEQTESSLDIREKALGLQEKIEAIRRRSDVRDASIPKSTIYSDSLVSVGNFLGSSSSAITQIGEKTNTLLQQANTYLERIASTANNSSGGILVPT